MFAKTLKNCTFGLGAIALPLSLLQHDSESNNAMAIAPRHLLER
jgi:hypothetical protein